MNGHKVGFKLAVGVGEDSLQSRNELCGATLIWTQEEPLLVIIISMNIVPDDWGPSKDFRHLLNRLHRNIFGDHFGTYTQNMK